MDYEKECQKLQAELEKKAIEIQQLKDGSNKLRDEVSTIKDDKYSLQGKVSSLEMELSRSKDENKDMRSTILNLSKYLSTLNAGGGR